MYPLLLTLIGGKELTQGAAVLAWLGNVDATASTRRCFGSIDPNRMYVSHELRPALTQNDLTDVSLSPFVARPLYQTATSQWRALSSGAPVAPTSAFSYISRALRQTAPHIVGALRLLAASYSPSELNEKGFALYAEFRPASEGWGQRGEVRCSAILGLRKPHDEEDPTPAKATPSNVDQLVKIEPPEETGVLGEDTSRSEDSSGKKLKLEPPTRDEYDAALDDDALFDEFDLSTIP